jgi:hypothetical protein
LFIANYRVAPEASSFTTIPSEVLVGLSALPVGGVRAVLPSDAPAQSEHASIRSTEPLIRLTIASQSPTEAESTPEKPPSTSVEQGPPSPPPPPTPAVEEVWRKALDDLFRNDPWQGRLNQWLEGLSPASLTDPNQEETALDSTFEDLDSLGAALPRSFSDEPASPRSQVWASAGLLLGMGAISVTEMKKRHTVVPAQGSWEATWRSLP